MEEQSYTYTLDSSVLLNPNRVPEPTHSYTTLSTAVCSVKRIPLPIQLGLNAILASPVVENRICFSSGLNATTSDAPPIVGMNPDPWNPWVTITSTDPMKSNKPSPRL